MIFRLYDNLLSINSNVNVDISHREYVNYVEEIFESRKQLFQPKGFLFRNEVAKFLKESDFAKKYLLLKSEFIEDPDERILWICLINDNVEDSFFTDLNLVKIIANLDCICTNTNNFKKLLIENVFKLHYKVGTPSSSDYAYMFLRLNLAGYKISRVEANEFYKEFLRGYFYRIPFPSSISSTAVSLPFFPYSLLDDKFQEEIILLLKEFLNEVDDDEIIIEKYRDTMLTYNGYISFLDSVVKEFTNKKNDFFRLIINSGLNLDNNLEFIVKSLMHNHCSHEDVSKLINGKLDSNELEYYATNSYIPLLRYLHILEEDHFQLDEMNLRYCYSGILNFMGRKKTELLSSNYFYLDEQFFFDYDTYLRFLQDQNMFKFQDSIFNKYPFSRLKGAIKKNYLSSPNQEKIVEAKIIEHLNNNTFFQLIATYEYFSIKYKRFGLFKKILIESKKIILQNSNIIKFHYYNLVRLKILEYGVKDSDTDPLNLPEPFTWIEDTEKFVSYIMKVNKIGIHWDKCKNEFAIWETKELYKYYVNDNIDEVNLMRINSIKEPQTFLLIKAIFLNLQKYGRKTSLNILKIKDLLDEDDINEHGVRVRRIPLSIRTIRSDISKKDKSLEILKLLKLEKDTLKGGFKPSVDNKLLSIKNVRGKNKKLNF